MQRTIEIFIRAGQWHVTFHGDSRVLEAFGRNTLPMPFTALVDAETAIATLEARNPGVRILYTPPHDPPETA